jgi:predicted MFS family arabinose efflux permease
MWGGLAIGPVAAAALGGNALWFAAATSAAALALAAGGDARDAPGARSPAVAARGAGSPAVAAHGAGSPAAATSSAAAARARLLPPQALRLGVLLGLSSFGYGTLNAFISTRTSDPGLALGLFAGAFVLTRALGSRLVDDLGPRTVARISIAVEAAALLGIPHPAALILLGAGLALVLPALMLWLVDITPGHERGAAVGALTSCWDVGIALAGPLGALAVSHAFAIAAAAAASATLLAGSASPTTARTPAPARQPTR